MKVNKPTQFYLFDHLSTQDNWNVTESQELFFYIEKRLIYNYYETVFYDFNHKNKIQWRFCENIFNLFTSFMYLDITKRKVSCFELNNTIVSKICLIFD